MMKCKKCKSPLQDGDHFCGYCQTKVVDDPICLDQATPSVEEKESGIRVEYNANRKLLEGSMLPLEFRIHSNEALSEVALSVCSTNKFSAEREVIYFSSGGDIALDVAVPCGSSGTVNLDVSLKARRGDMVLKLHGTCKHEVCPAPSDGEVHINVNQGHAGEVHISNLNKSSTFSDKQTLICELNALEASWKILPTRIVSEVVATNGAQSIVVETENGSIQLVKSNFLTFGRSRDNHVVTRLTGFSSERLDPLNEKNPNRFISGHQCWFHRTDDGVYVVDGDRVGGKPSSSGTFMDGERVFRKKVPDSPVMLSLSNKDVSRTTTYSLRVLASEKGVVLQAPNRSDCVCLWLFGVLEFEGSVYEHRGDAFYRDGVRVCFS